jgi:tetratricopeptide (TPR) repeat protein
LNTKGSTTPTAATRRRSTVFIAALLAVAAAGCSRVSPEEHLRRANDDIVARRYEDARKEYTAMLADLRGDDQGSQRYKRKALYRMGRLHYLFMNQPEAAIDYLKQAVSVDPKAPLSFNSLTLMGRIYQDTLRDYPQAILAYQTAIAYFPRHRHIDRYHHRLIESYFKIGNMNQVRAEGMASVLALPQSRHADDILYLVAEACLAERDKAQAEKVLGMLIERYSAGEWTQQAHYELGELLEERGRTDQALEQYELAVPGFRDSAVLKRKIANLKAKR